MPSDYENGAKKTIDISIKAEKMTADVLKSALQEFLSGKNDIIHIIGMQFLSWQKEKKDV